jgi:Tol biopolymer transport system component/tRNA A-37 threonylcarbamoyl transferase component Bud32
VAQLGSEGEATGLTGCRLGPYQVRERIGAGGMGEVYRARDSKLGRDVAVKVLPPHSMQDPDVVARFEREARLLATLNHPNIGAIYGFESAGDVHAIVLELIDGETLTQRINYAPIPILEAVGIARQIADALDAAHSRGIIHRDLKPGNIKITSESVVKVLDFGLAKAVTPQHFDDGDSETLSLSQTAIGTILGTPAYMSPEQASGEPVDKRTGIWAFGCVFYQMITGRSAFGRDSILDTLAAIIDGAADMSALPANTPYGVRRLLERCLEKDPRRRLRDIADGVLLLDEAGPALPADGAAQAGLRPGWMQWALAAIVLGAVGAGLALWIQAKKNDPARAAIVRTTIVLPGGAKLASGDRELPLAISPDGSRIAYVADEDGRRVLYVREMNSLEPRALAGADEARHPFFSPDGESVGYFADGALQRVPVSGGLPLRICDVPGVSMGGTWAPDHTIVFATYGSDLARVSDSGGSPKALEGSAPAAWPETLPDGKTILFTSGAGNNLSALAMIPMAGGAKRVFARLATSALQAPAVIGSGGSLLEAHVVRSGYLLYGQSPGVIRVVPFDLAAQKVTGSPLSLGGSVERAKNGGGVYFAVSQTGLLVYASTGNRHQLVWVDRKGNATPLLPDKGPYRMPRISPDGRLLAVAVTTGTTLLGQISTGGQAIAGVTISPDGSRLYVTSEVAGSTAAAGANNAVLTKTNCVQQAGSAAQANGLLTVINVAEAEANPSSTAIVATVNAGCSPVRAVETADGSTLWVSARGDNRVLAFSTGMLESNPGNALLGYADTGGTAPVGLRLFAGGKLLAVANSNRFLTGSTANATVLSVAVPASATVVQTIATGLFPREITVGSDDRTLYLTNYNSGSFQVISTTVH